MNIYDNTLREGLQNPMIFLDINQKMKILEAQINAGIKNIEIGFVAVDDREKEDIRILLEHKKKANLYCLSRLMKSDIEECAQLNCENITIFVPSSDDMIKLKIKKTISEIEKEIVTLVGYASDLGLNVRFSCEDATNTPVKRLIKFYTLAEQCGAKTISVPDTNGISTPFSSFKLISTLRSNISCRISMHCHNDLGLATANALAGVEAGADEVQTTINGIGERMGNTDLSEILIILKKYYNYELEVNSQNLRMLYTVFSEVTGMPIRDDKPIMGENQFTHESGLHVRAILQGKGYESFPPEWIDGKHKILYGALSGMANIEYFCNKHSIQLSNESKTKLLEKIKYHSRTEKRYICEYEILNMIGEINGGK